MFVHILVWVGPPLHTLVYTVVMYVCLCRHLGVVGVDVRLTDVEQILFSQQWGTLYSFMTNNQGEVIIHPRLTPATEVRICVNKQTKQLYTYTRV